MPPISKNVIYAASIVKIHLQKIKFEGSPVLGVLLFGIPNFRDPDFEGLGLASLVLVLNYSMLC